MLQTHYPDRRRTARNRPGGRDPLPAGSGHSPPWRGSADRRRPPRAARRRRTRCARCLVIAVLAAVRRPEPEELVAVAEVDDLLGPPVALVAAVLLQAERREQLAVERERPLDVRHGQVDVVNPACWHCLLLSNRAMTFSTGAAPGSPPVRGHRRAAPARRA